MQKTRATAALSAASGEEQPSPEVDTLEAVMLKAAKLKSYAFSKLQSPGVLHNVDVLHQIQGRSHSLQSIPAHASPKP